MIQAMIWDLQERVPPVRSSAPASVLRTAYGLRPGGMQVVRTATARREPRPTDVPLSQ